ncbi:MAG: glycosyltransferase family 2 protein [Solirubrobacterales bacterium]|jgi:glycosyltransferase involved in cell wall biosynthesis|nr:glycosyltransferase family 2 protein [Solirubrobacterales bacterium]
MSSKLAIVPAYNEEASVGFVVRELHEHAPDFDVVVVDDGSTDATGRVAREAGAAVLRMPFNLGIGGTVQAGYQYALEREYDYAVQVDGDGQHEAREVATLLAHLRSADVDLVTGSRFLRIDEDSHRSTRSRRLGIAVFSRVLSLVTGQPVTDPTSGFRMVNSRGIALFARDYPHDYPEVEAVLMVHAHRLRSAEVPVRMRPRTTGVSSINASRSIYYMIKVLLALFVGLCRARPVVEAGDRSPVAAESSI